MIVDELREVLGEHGRSLFERATIIRVPWRLRPDRDWTPEFTEKMPMSFVPIRDGQVSWAELRMPYPIVIMVSTFRESGAFVIQETTVPGGWAHHDNPTVSQGDRQLIVLDLSLPTSQDYGLMAAAFRYSIRYNGQILSEGSYETGVTDEFIEWRVKHSELLWHQLQGQAMSSEEVEQLRTKLRRLRRNLFVDCNNTLMLVTALAALLSCKNVHLHQYHPSDKIQRRRVARGHLPLFSYHELVVRGLATGGAGGEPGMGDVALHWVRGHFKRYTEANKLFGKHVGLYWWQPHVAGTADRIVEKQYRVELT